MRLGALFLACVVLEASSLSPGPQPGASWTLTLSYERATVLIGEPVTPYLGITNTAAEELSLHVPPEAEQGFAAFEISLNGQARDYRPVMIKEGPRAMIRLKPDEKVAWPCRLYYGADGWTMARAGAYTITARVGQRSALLHLTVVEPDDPAVRHLAHALVADPEAGRALYFSSGTHLRQGWKMLERVAQSSPPSLLSSYASLALGHYWSSAAPDFDSKKMRAADVAKAEALLQTALKSSVLDTAAREKGLNLLLKVQVDSSSPTAQDTRQVLGKLTIDRAARLGATVTEMQTRK
jgi:hypothetical protein